MSFAVEMPDRDDVEGWKAFNEMMDEVNEASSKAIDNIMAEHQVDFQTANAVWYLRSRERWTQEKENELLEWKKVKSEQFPNVFSGEF